MRFPMPALKIDGRAGASNMTLIGGTDNSLLTAGAASSVGGSFAHKMRPGGVGDGRTDAPTAAKFESLTIV